jgi:hypothetical protein
METIWRQYGDNMETIWRQYGDNNAHRIEIDRIRMLAFN